MLSPDVHTSGLPNGLRVVTVALPHLHIATTAVFIKVGSRFESRSNNGLSHFLEHMLFRGTERYRSSYDLNVAIETLGGTLEAETGRDYSMFHIAVEPRGVPESLELFGELFRRPLFSDIELERRLILEEMNEDYDERDTEINSDDIVRGLLFGDHPLGQRIIGPRANVQRFTDADVRAHFERFYCANNMLVCVAGPVEHARVTDAAAEYMGALEPGSAAVATSVDVPGAGDAAYRYVSDPGSQTNVNLALHTVPDVDDDYVASVAMLRTLDDGMATRLHYRLCDQRALAYSVHASIEPLADAAVLDVSGATSHSKVADLVGGVLELLGEFRDTPVADAELARVKRRYETDLVASVDEGAAMAGWFGGTALYYEPPSLDVRRAQMNDIGPDDIVRVARRIVRPERLAVAAVGALSPAQQGEVRDAISSWRP